jgi:hypothetical protein
MHGKLRLLFGSALVVGMVASSLLYADAIGVPRSNLVIEGKVFLASGVSAHFHAREGTMLTVRDVEAGQWYGFIPIINPDTKVPNFSANVLTPVPGGDRVEEVNSGVDIQRNSSYRFFQNGSAVDVQVLGVKPGRFSKVVLVDPRGQKPLELQRRYGAVSGGRCVLTCGGITVGANAVEMDCGSCQGEGID